MGVSCIITKKHGNVLIFNCVSFKQTSLLAYKRIFFFCSISVLAQHLTSPQTGICVPFSSGGLGLLDWYSLKQNRTTMALF